MKNRKAIGILHFLQSKMTIDGADLRLPIEQKDCYKLYDYKLKNNKIYVNKVYKQIEKKNR